MASLRKLVKGFISLRDRDLNQPPSTVSLGVMLPAAYPKTKDGEVSDAGLQFMRRAWPKLLEGPGDGAVWGHYVDARGDKNAQLTILYSTVPEHRDRDKQILSKESGGNLTFYDAGNPLHELRQLLIGTTRPRSQHERGAQCGNCSFIVLHDGGGWKDLQCDMCGNLFTDESTYTGDPVEAVERDSQLSWDNSPEPEDEDAAAAFIEATMNGG